MTPASHTLVRRRSLRPRRRSGAEHRPTPLPPPRPEGGRPTLEQVLQGVWEGLHADGTTECPACHGRMELAAAGACGDCGATLS